MQQIVLLAAHMWTHGFHQLAHIFVHLHVVSYLLGVFFGIGFDPQIDRDMC